ncbi:MAG TPA: YetF domain-containing protein [Paraburkholderia sp.]|jgi:uncharacterized membrane protein YcaP (DUF421 family)|nr:YetF domain-containing protein [Paraburkholderia sp.]
MNTLTAWFGSGRDLDPLQMTLRAVVVFVVALVLIRISGRRSFGNRSPFDYVIAILLGATLSRAIVGASPFAATVAASFAMVVMHRALAWLCIRSPRLERLVVGDERVVFSHGQFNEREMHAALLTRTDVYESVRQATGACDLKDVDAAILERNGQVSVIRKTH